MNIDPDDRQDLLRRLFALAGRRLEHAADAAGQGEAAGLGREVLTNLAGDLHDCGQDLLVVADAIAVMAGEAAGQ